MASPGTVTISGTAHTVYADRADADVYFAAHFSNADWAGLGSQKDVALVMATRLLEVQSWQGLPTDLATPQPLAWPRTGVTDKNSQAVADDAFPQDLLNGFYELALAVGLDPSLNGTATNRNTQKRVKAGDVEVENFAPATAAEKGTRLPFSAQQFLKQFFSGANTVLGGLASGTDECSQFDNGQNVFGVVEGLK